MAVVSSEASKGQTLAAGDTQTVARSFCRRNLNLHASLGWPAHFFARVQRQKLEVAHIAGHHTAGPSPKHP